MPRLPTNLDLRVAFLGKGTNHVLTARRKSIEKAARKLTDSQGDDRRSGEPVHGEGGEDRHSD